MPWPMGAIETWMQAHDDLDRGLRQLRRIWSEGRPHRSLLALDQFECPLALHLHHEETVLMPAYRELADDLPPNAAPRVLQSDHAQLRELLATLRAGVEARSVEAILAEQDTLCRLTGVLEHHDLRERTWFVPTLDDRVPTEVTEAWVAEFARAEAALPEPVALLVAPAPPIDLDLSGVDALSAFRIAVARDQPLPERWAAVPTPDHPRGPRLMAKAAAVVDAVEAAATLEARRDRLAELSEIARLIAIVVTASRTGS